MTLDNTIYANDAYAQALLQDARDAAAENVVDPVTFDENYKDLEPAIYSGKPIIISGPPQNGKSTAVQLLSAKLGIPCIPFSCDDGIQKSNVFGCVTIGPNGDTVWEDGPLLKAYRNGYWFDAEEVLQLPPEKTSMFMKITDGSKIYVGYKGEIIHRHPNFRFIATGNPNCRGNKKGNQAFSRRLCFTIDVADLSAKGFLLLGKSKRSWVNTGFFNAAYSLSQAIVAEAARLGKPNESCGITQLCGLFDLIENDPTKLTLDVFTRKVRNTFINVLIKAQVTPQERDLFQNTPATAAIINKMYNEYINSPKPVTPSPSATAAAQPSTTAPQPAQPASGNALLNKLRGIKI